MIELWNKGNEFPLKTLKIDCSYILRITLSKDSVIRIGQKGCLKFLRGIYFYVGSAKKNLYSRVSRHLYKNENKKLRWHIDYLLSDVNIDTIQAKTYSLEECVLSRELQNEEELIKIKKFGCSDCKCSTHLFLKLCEKDFHGIKGFYKN